MCPRSTPTWLSIQGFVLILAAFAAAVPGLREVLANGYIGAGMNGAALSLFLARYWQWFPSLLIAGLLWFAVAYWNRRRKATLRYSMIFAAMVLLVTVALHYASTLLVTAFLSDYTINLQMAVHQFPEAVRETLLRQIELMFGGMRRDPLAIYEFFVTGRWTGMVTFAFFFAGAYGLTLMGARLGERRLWQRLDRQFTPMKWATPGSIWLPVIGLLIAGAMGVLSPSALTAGEASRPNIILVSIDTVRADHVSAYGYERSTTPNIDALAKRGVLFEKAISQSSWTLPAHASMLTGKYPVEHDCTAVEGTVLQARETTVAELLADAGYRTIGITSSHFVSGIYGLDQGFETFAFRQTDAAKLVDAAIAQLRRTDDRPFFLFLHLFDPHDPYTPPEEYAELYLSRGELEEVSGNLNHDMLKNGPHAFSTRQLEILKGRYDAEIRYSDNELGRLLDELRRAGMDRQTAIIVTSDHGESFNEHGIMAHGTSLYTEELHVPLVIKPPQELSEGKRVGGLVEASVTIAPTILEFAGVSHDIAGRPSLQSLWRRDSLDETAHAETALSIFPLYSYQDADWKIITPAQATVDDSLPSQLFDAKHDWADEKNVAAIHLDVVRRYVDDHVFPYIAVSGTDPTARKVNLSPLEIQKLRSLGYLSR
ncbi:MAG: sulfatase [Candidatus Lernaella stagnicola]|nr:sulfatase [Candidatus Lernaella stagnicola]